MIFDLDLDLLLSVGFKVLDDEPPLNFLFILLYFLDKFFFDLREECLDLFFFILFFICFLE